MAGKGGVRLQARVTCPHCWHSFPPENTHWVAQAPELMGDQRLGPEAQLRFLPTRFNVKGEAVDAQGFACHELACPHCHLNLSRALVELEPVFVSILGTPACGKSYYLTSMVWKLRQTLPKHFGMSFGDADPSSNRLLHDYEEQQFLNADQNRLVAIRKTELQGELYDSVLFGEQTVSFPRPFLFSLRPLDHHPNRQSAAQISRVLCVYDNAGEHFLPGSDTAAAPVTRHLAMSRVLFFLFDPTQDPRFRSACEALTQDPQVHDRARTIRQETVLLEAADRIRRHAGVRQTAKHDRPLVVVVTKFDAWAPLLKDDLDKPPWDPSDESAVGALDVARVEAISQKVRALLWSMTPEIVSAAEGFAREVVYIPVSATGRSPEIDRETGMLGVRPRDLEPRWVEVPMIYTMCRWMTGIVPKLRPTPLKVVHPDREAS